MSEVLFYHLEHKSWEHVLPKLIASTLQRGWKAVVQVAQPDRVEPVSEALWTCLPEDSFLAHGTAADGNAERQPVWVTAGEDTPNAATVRFFLEGAAVENAAALARAVVLFDGADAAAVERARADWKRLQAEGHAISYWQQDENLRWQNRSQKSEAS